MTLGLKFPHAVGASDGGAADETRDLFGDQPAPVAVECVQHEPADGRRNDD
eukprot:CAMPEP_0181198972 /NCGR_PEP_ID=MMETSP1096-20121128/16922_1 /TAXON_ID=156174 ORGANISM="Chrysochromulina ericina, Strain CCMP281" /NCGR_SAMPLE_ID=MMETSP1096 /ASSEMBLY_ACC=CAM_ASM_000453 /LENGTH=50 /DNA_ID=CAMNT_0023289111 /DNA_START=545 /DNA_END=694 /DNA_ORIENTATION=+